MIPRLLTNPSARRRSADQWEGPAAEAAQDSGLELARQGMGRDAGPGQWPPLSEISPRLDTEAREHAGDTRDSSSDKVINAMLSIYQIYRL